MSRLVIVLGIVLILVGGAGTVLGRGGFSTQFTDAITQATTANADDLCRPGETLEEEGGAESYTPGVGYGRNVRYFCVDDAGERREVTGDFVEGMLGNVGGALLPMLSGGLVTIISPLVLTFGFILAIIGFAFSRRRRSPTITQYVYSAGQGIPPTYTMPTTQTPTPSANLGFPTKPAARGDLTAKLRQLDEARQANLISDDEYQRMRKEILDSIG